jgi:hypothetical protein
MVAEMYPFLSSAMTVRVWLPGLIQITAFIERSNVKYTARWSK